MKNFLREHLLKFTGRKPVKLEFPVNWYQDPFKDRSWQWNLHTFRFLQPLIEEYGRDGNEAALDFGRELVSSWLAEFSGKRLTCSLRIAWQDHCTALRAIWFCRFGAVCPAAYRQRYSSFFDTLGIALEEHGRLLLREDFYSRNSNHGMDQSYALIELGMYRDWPKALKAGKERILGEFNYAFTAEGIHRENSATYHEGSLRRFIEIHDRFPALFAPENYEAVIDGALAWIGRIVRPDGRYPIMGDCMAHPPGADWPESVRNLPGHGELLFSLSGGREGARPKQLQRVYRESGYAVFRDAWPDPQSWQQGCQIIVKIGSTGLFHYHADEGNILACAFGEDWLIDSGALNYVENDPLRKHARSRAAHNVADIPGENYDVATMRQLPRWKLNAWNEADASPWLDFDFFWLNKYLLRRKVRFDARKLVLDVDDSIYAPLDFVADLNFQIPADKQVEIVGNKIIVRSSAHQMQIEVESADLVDMALFTHDQGAGTVSFCSRIMFSLEATQRIAVKLRGRKRARAFTRIAFS